MLMPLIYGYFYLILKIIIWTVSVWMKIIFYKLKEKSFQNRKLYAVCYRNYFCIFAFYDYFYTFIYHNQRDVLSHYVSSFSFLPHLRVFLFEYYNNAKTIFVRVRNLPQNMLIKFFSENPLE